LDDRYVLRFAESADAAKPVARYWRPRAALPRPTSAARPLAGLKVAIDPGHLGGDWARMEERWFQVGDSPPVTEGDLTLRVARLLASQLTALGAEVSMVRDREGPTTPLRPEMLRDAAHADLAQHGHVHPPEHYSDIRDPRRADSVQFRSEVLFFRVAEIRHRARLVNQQLRPDLVLCLHFDADAWGDPAAPVFSPRNRLHALMNGAYSAEELQLDDVRRDMLVKLLGRTAREELDANTRIVRVLARRLALPPYVYTRDIAIQPGGDPYVWARNLLANRLYECPVVFLEPYAMNNAEVFARIQAGDFEGERVIAGSVRRSIFREYADAVAEGVAAWFANE
jgi:N-acetylmuramoyl-L-alanine amidase